LFGIDVDSLKISQVFKFPSVIDDGSPYKSKNNVSYQQELHQIIDDSLQLCGWFQSTTLGKFINESLVDSMIYGQKQNKNSVVIVYDQSKASYGVLSLKAYRLKASFVESYPNVKSVDETIFDEVTISIHNNYLNSLVLAAYDQEFFNNTESLKAGKSLGEDLEQLIDSVDELNQFYYQLIKKKELNVQELIPIKEKVAYVANDLEQSVVTEFLIDSAIRP
jgi:translation initiation factor 3 subunit H